MKNWRQNGTIGNYKNEGFPVILTEKTGERIEKLYDVWELRRDELQSPMS